MLSTGVKMRRSAAMTAQGRTVLSRHLSRGRGGAARPSSHLRAAAVNHGSVMMDSFEWNKIFGGVLGTLLFVAALNILVDEFMTPEKPASGGMTVATPETPTSGTSAPEAKP